MNKKIMGLSLLCVLSAAPLSPIHAQTGVSNAWTAWLDRDEPSGQGDAEVLPAFLTETPNSVCTTPSAIEARIRGTTNVFTPGMTLPQTMRTFEPTKGLQCYNVDQRSGSCADYEVRFLCAAPTLGQTKAVLEKMEVFKLQAPVSQGNAIAQATFKLDAAMEALNGRFSFDMEGVITAFNDRAEGADEKSGDGIFSAFITMNFTDITDTQTAFNNKLRTVTNPIVREFAGRSVVTTKTFAATSSSASTVLIRGMATTAAPEPLPAPTPPALVLAENALVINDKAVVANAGLTFDMCNTDGTGNSNPNAAWSFKTLLSNLNNELTSGITDQQFINEWLRNWMVDSFANDTTILARTGIKGFFPGWDGVNAQTLNLDQLPFRLLAIVNRIDLATIPAYGASTANKPGEIRFVFGLVQRNGSQCSAAPMTAIFEYRDATSSCSGLKDLANKWLNLDSIGVQFGRNSANYRDALKAITDTVTAPNANKLNQLRTNDIAFGSPWQLREFVISGGKLSPTTIKQTPNPVQFQATTAPGAATTKDYLQQNANGILCENYTVPETIGTQRFLGASTDYGFSTTWPITPDVVPASFPTCYKSSVTNTNGTTLDTRIKSEVRHKFALNTCDACHSGETRTGFVHIDWATRGLSGFMTGINVTDPVNSLLTRQFNDLARRNQALVGTAATSCTTDPRILRSFRAQQARLRFIH
ncbi:hypothetical protein D0C16_14370 [Cellvibrio sp. KY-GH-1]|uniref:hypothetical protein n=1 Tax=Cellvibrio sp. KY-GH-1 TaxID=2303332 RepID=UPI0012489C6B|nr:hypothetical protein [Cellvibrio sp. KY-GH-1]QEY17057.1 hypothetical protein D0C16_14370 [Cellvibrio sp. KY-GH-1]